MPEQQRRTAQVEAVRRIQAPRRASRGLVAGYIHELSARHADDARATRQRPPVYARTIAKPEATAGV